MLFVPIFGVMVPKRKHTTFEDGESELGLTNYILQAFRSETQMAR
jgi:hypothetical protein